MARVRTVFQFALMMSVVMLAAGCLALSFGGKTQTVDDVVTESPETLARIDRLESRVQSLEQQLSPQFQPPQIQTPGISSISK